MKVTLTPEITMLFARIGLAPPRNDLAPSPEHRIGHHTLPRHPALWDRVRRMRA
ncbi:hypothetical protein [Thioclava sp.]|uniref:hypothetical protein n=1 Tax=Thioclava sp. TaxID=1933450 RepID=UPI003AA880C5